MNLPRSSFFSFWTSTLRPIHLLSISLGQWISHVLSCLNIPHSLCGKQVHMQRPVLPPARHPRCCRGYAVDPWADCTFGRRGKKRIRRLECKTSCRSPPAPDPCPPPLDSESLSFASWYARNPSAEGMEEYHPGPGVHSDGWGVRLHSVYGSSRSQDWGVLKDHAGGIYYLRAESAGFLRGHGQDDCWEQSRLDHLRSSLTLPGFVQLITAASAPSCLFNSFPTMHCWLRKCISRTVKCWVFQRN